MRGNSLSVRNSCFRRSLHWLCLGGHACRDVNRIAESRVQFSCGDKSCNVARFAVPQLSASEEPGHRPRRLFGWADLRPLSLGGRKARLARLLRRPPAAFELNTHTDDDGSSVFAAAYRMGLEGIV